MKPDLKSFISFVAFIIFVVGMIFAAIMYDDYKHDNFRQDFRQKYKSETTAELESAIEPITENSTNTLVEDTETENISDSVTSDTGIYAPKTWGMRHNDE